MSSLLESFRSLGLFSATTSPAKPASREQERLALRALAQTSLYFLCKWVLGFADLTPRFHGPLCRELDNVRLPYGRRLDLWPRGHLKTHIITIGKSIQDYLRDNNVRILLASAGIDGAKKNLGAIKRQFESNEKLQWLFPECRPDIGGKWAETEACLPRDKNLPEPTFKCIGVGGHITGWHFDIIRKDDLIDEKTEKSPEVMQKITDWHLLSKNLLESPTRGIDHLIGTRWAMTDTYQYVIDHEPEYDVRVVDALDAKGYPRWAERFTAEALLRLREKDPYQFATQQQNNPRLQEAVNFNPKWLRYFIFGKDTDLLIESTA